MKVVNAAAIVSGEERETSKKVKRMLGLTEGIVGRMSDNTKSERRVLPERCNGQEAFTSATVVNIDDIDEPSFS